MSTEGDIGQESAVGRLEGCFLGSILLEPRRWQRESPPVLRLADWIEPIIAAGFDGIEIWEPHWTYATAEERRQLRASGLRFIFNSYASLDAAGQAARELATTASAQLCAEGIKFNLGRNWEHLATECAVVKRWADSLPPSCRLLCECHADTLAETPAVAAKLARDWVADRIGFITHPFFSKDLTAWIEALSDRILHLHIQTRAAENRHQFVALADVPTQVASRWTLLAQVWAGGTATIEFTAGVDDDSSTATALLAQARADAAYLRQLDCGASAKSEHAP